MCDPFSLVHQGLLLFVMCLSYQSHYSMGTLIWHS